MARVWHEGHFQLGLLEPVHGPEQPDRWWFRRDEERPRLAPAPVTYRVEFGGGAQVQFHGLPEDARDALVERAADLA